MKAAVIYARYSSERQTEQSIEGQLRVCNEFAEHNGLKIVDTYIDRAMTGKNDNRAAFQKMLSDSDKPQPWDIVLVYSLDRFGRNSIEIALNKQRLLKNGKILISATQRTSINIDGSQNLDGIILENVLIGLSEYYSAELSQKIKRGLNESRIKGNFTGARPPYGYIVVNKKLQIDETKAEVVRYMYRSYASGMIVREIIQNLTKQGITYKNKPFNQNTVYNILRLEKYVGVYRYGEEVFTNTYPQIISNELYNEVQLILKRKKIGSSSRDTEFLLKSKIVCGYCGKNINGESGTSRTGTINYYYKCSNRKKRHNCNKKSVKKADLETLVLDVTFTLFDDPDILSSIANEIVQIHEQRVKAQSVLNILRDSRSQKQKALDNVMRAIEAGIFTATTKDRINALEKEIDELNIRILAEECKSANQITKEDVVTYLRNSLKNKPQSIIELLIDKVILYDDKIEIYYKYIPYNNPDDSLKETRRDFSIQNINLTVTQQYVIYISSI